MWAPHFGAPGRVADTEGSPRPASVFSRQSGGPPLKQAVDPCLRFFLLNTCWSSYLSTGVHLSVNRISIHLLNHWCIKCLLGTLMRQLPGQALGEQQCMRCCFIFRIFPGQERLPMFLFSFDFVLVWFQFFVSVPMRYLFAFVAFLARNFVYWFGYFRSLFQCPG